MGKMRGSGNRREERALHTAAAKPRAALVITSLSSTVSEIVSL